MEKMAWMSEMTRRRRQHRAKSVRDSSAGARCLTGIQAGLPVADTPRARSLGPPLPDCDALTFSGYM